MDYLDLLHTLFWHDTQKMKKKGGDFHEFICNKKEGSNSFITKNFLPHPLFGIVGDLIKSLFTGRSERGNKWIKISHRG